MEGHHESVLLEESVAALEIESSDVVLDATLGGAGHFSAILGELGENGILIGVDADPEAVERARAVAAEDHRSMRPVIHLLTDNFRNLERMLDRLDVPQLDKALFDLGWSGYQLSAGRGFSFQLEEPLLMTYAVDTEGLSAADIVNTWTETDIADVIFEYGEERFARKIAHAIVEARGKRRILTTKDLVDAVKAGTPKWYHTRRTHPATKTFQALRIAANDEFGALREGLTAAMGRLSPNGRIAVISFHSLEDRIVKNIFREAVARGEGALPVKKPIVPAKMELARNPRARSAKLRVFERSAEVRTSVPSTLTHAYA